MTDLLRVLRSIGEEGPPDPLAPGWEESMRTVPPSIGFLDEQEVRRAREYCGLDAVVEEPLCACARRIVADDSLRRLSWHAARVLFETSEPVDFGRWPGFRASLGEGEPIREGGFSAGGGSFYLLVALAMVPRVIETHERLGIEPEVTRQTCRQVRCFAGNYRAGTGGRLGVFAKQLYWLRHYTEGRLFRLGRFEYMRKPYAGGIALFRDTVSGSYLALAPDGWTYDRDGFAVAADGNPPTAVRRGTPPFWTSTLRIDDREAQGHPIHPSGRTLETRVTLDLGRWQRAVEPGDTVLDLHIPADGRMPIEACAESFAAAVSFFARHFPETPAKAVWCASWIFGPQLEEILPAHSNLVRFLRQGYLAPIPSSSSSLWFIYLDEEVDPRSAPRANSLQAAVSDFLARGGIWRDASMIYPVELLPEFGNDPLRSSWPQALESARRGSGCAPDASGLS